MGWGNHGCSMEALMAAVAPAGIAMPAIFRQPVPAFTRKGGAAQCAIGDPNCHYLCLAKIITYPP